MKYQGNICNHSYKFNSLTQFIEEVKIIPTNKRKYSIEISDEQNKFSQSGDMSEAFKIAVNGYELKTINSGLDTVRTNEVYKTEIEYSVAGGCPDVPEFLTGNPECMINYNAIPEDNKYIHLVLDTFESHKIEAKQFINKIISIAAIINDLEVNGYRVKLSLMMCSKFNCGLVGYTICLKEYEQSLGLSEIAGTLHPSFLRRIQFLFIEGSDWWRPTKKKKCLDKVYGNYAGIQIRERFMDEQTNEPYMFIESVTAAKHFNTPLYKQCDSFNSLKGAKTYANHIKNKIEAL